MKRISLFLLLPILLASCATSSRYSFGNAATPAPNVTVTSKVTVTFTPPPTQTPTITSTATEIPDPNAPADMTGVTREKNADGTYDYFRTVEGEKQQWQVVMDGETVVFSDWTVDHIKDSDYIPMMPGGGHVAEGFPMQFFVQDGLSANYISHPTGAGMKAGGYMGSVEMVLYNRYKLEHPEITRQDFWNTIWPDKYETTVTDVDGKDHTITDNTSFKIVLVDADSLNDDAGNLSFDFKTKTISGRSDILSRTIFDDDSHTVTILVASSLPVNELNDQEFIETLLVPFGHILVIPDQAQKNWLGSGLAQRAGSIANMALKGDPSYFTISDSP